MKKHLKKIIVFLILCICAVNFSFATIVNAQGPYYQIPKRKDFRPSKAAAEIERIVNKKSVISCNATDNKISIDGALVAQKNNEAVEEIEGYISRLSAGGMHLDRELVNTVTVKTRDINLTEFVEIAIDAENIEKITDVNSLKIVLEKNNEYIVLNNESINMMKDTYGEFKIQIKRLSDTYTIRFLDKNYNIINKCSVDIGVALPAKHNEQTVYLFMNNTQENWGGQYNYTYSSIEFMTKYSGEYNVASPEINIKDIDELSEYEKSAIRFMVVRGYFNLSNGKFKPFASLTRYDFAEALVRMFFALDNDARCSFPDVDRKHYRYVAASEQDGIVQGFDDGTFKGKNNVTVEQVIALTSRTINLKNGYVYPESVEKYLNFTDDNIIGDWAEKEIAMAIREGIYSNDMNLKFSDNITRKDAAVILYRLFMIMHNTPELSEAVEYDINNQVYHETAWNLTNVIITGSAVIVVDAAALILSILFVRKKRKR